MRNKSGGGSFSLAFDAPDEVLREVMTRAAAVLFVVVGEGKTKLLKDLAGDAAV